MNTSPRAASAGAAFLVQYMRRNFHPCIEKNAFKITAFMLYCSVTTGHDIHKPWKIERQEGNQDEAYSDTEHTDSAEYREKRWLRRVPDILPVSM